MQTSARQVTILEKCELAFDVTGVLSVVISLGCTGLNMQLCEVCSVMSITLKFFPTSLLCFVVSSVLWSMVFPILLNHPTPPHITPEGVGGSLLYIVHIWCANGSCVQTSWSRPSPWCVVSCEGRESMSSRKTLLCAPSVGEEVLCVGSCVNGTRSKKHTHHFSITPPRCIV